MDAYETLLNKINDRQSCYYISDNTVGIIVNKCHCDLIECKDVNEEYVDTWDTIEIPNIGMFDVNIWRSEQLQVTLYPIINERTEFSIFHSLKSQKQKK